MSRNAPEVAADRPARPAVAALVVVALAVLLRTQAAPLPWPAVAALAAPLGIGAVLAADLVPRAPYGRSLRLLPGLAAAAAVYLAGAVAALPAAWLAETSEAALLRLVPAEAALAFAVVTAAGLLRSRAPGAARGAARAVGVPSLATALVAGVLATVPAAPAAAGTADPPVVRPCVAGQEQRDYDVSAVTVDVPFNRWGRTLRSARIFVLEQDRAATVNWWRPLAADSAADPAGNRRLRPRPLVLRANEGECVKVTLRNRIEGGAGHGLPAAPRVGIQAAGVVTDARTSGGAQVGFNDDPTVGFGEAKVYYWRVPAQEGLFMFQDMATPAGGEHDAGSRGVGLYGALAVEPAGSTWTDPRSGAVLSGDGSPGSTYSAARGQSGELYVEADIHPPGKPSFRESVQIAQDEIPGIGMGFNYGSEPLEDREARACPDCVGEETWLSSWPYGDPALVKLASGPGPWLPDGTGNRQEAEDCGLPESCFVANVFHTYTGDPTKIRFGLAGVKETHVFHLHAHQWLADPRDNAVQGEGPGAKPESTTLDSQSYGPGEAYTAELLYGAGSRNGTFGDSIFHCHLYPHFAEGYWSIMRVHDVLLDGTGATPDGVNVRPLVPLPGGPNPPAPTPDDPGFPGMIPGTYGFRAPQPPGSVTEGGVDGTPERPAPRLVGGRAIDEAKLAVERAVMGSRNGGDEAKPGAPYADPCPRGAREVDYDVTVLQRDLVYNEAGHHDPQARFMVLTKDVPAVLAGTMKAEPLFIRVNAGDCVNFSLTNMAPNYTGGDAFQTLAETNMAGGHVHLVKFDVTASDGGSNGWNYQQAAFTKEQAELVAQQASGAVTCTPGTPFFGGASTGCRLPQRTDWTPPVDSSGMWGQTIHERWYADYELRTAFTHDHHFPAVVQNHGFFGALIVEPAGFDVRDPATGAFLQPVNDPAHGTPCGARCAGTAVGESVDLIGPGSNDDSREFGLAIADFVPLVKRGGDPRNPDDVVNPPGAPEHFPQADPGTFAVNYRNAPLQERRLRDGRPVDPAHRFSSWVFGDPRTPLLQGYAHDDVKVRLIQGSQEEQHLFQVHGLRWLEEPDDPGSPLVNAQPVGISEAFNAELPGYDCAGTDTSCRGDYLYGATTPEGLWNGMWGIMRVHGRLTPGLRALPDNVPGGKPSAAPPASRQAPPPAGDWPGAACPAGAPERRYDVVAIAHPLVYNEHGDHDPKGALYVLAEDEQAVRTGAERPEPLVLRANAGDCVRVSLRNALPPEYADHVNGVDGDIRLPLEPATGTPMGTRVSLHPQLVRHDVRRSDGAAVGFNPDSTAGVGETVRYEWFADTELGATNLVDYGDVRGHRQHGLFAALVVEPRFATYHDPVTGAEVRSGTVADIRVPGREDFREAVLLYEDGLDLRTSAGGAITTPEPGAEPGDLESHGEKGVNYTNAPVHRRLGAAPGGMAAAPSAAWSTVFSSTVHGDPRTPVLRTYTDDQLRLRVLNGSGKSPAGYFQSFALDGAVWRQEPYDAQTELVGNQGGIGTGRAVNVQARLSSPGDHMWSSPTSRGIPDGMWGLVRTYREPVDTDVVPRSLATPDDPFAPGRAPLVPLERRSATVQLFADADADGFRDAGEAPVAGVPVRLRTADGTVVGSTTSGADGWAVFSPTAGVYDLQVVPADGTGVTGQAVHRADLRGDNAVSRLSVGLAAQGRVDVLVYHDADTDGTQDAGEPGLAGWTVALRGASPVGPVTTGEDGHAVLTGIAPGEWSATVQARSGWRVVAEQPVTVTGLPDATPSAAVGVTRLEGTTVRAVDDADADGVPEDSEAAVPGLVVSAQPAGGATVTRTTDDRGTAVVDVGRAPSTLRVLRPDTGVPWPCTTALVSTPAGTTPVTCGADGSVALPAGATEVVVLGQFTDGLVTTALFNDANRNERRDVDEAPLADWAVALVTGDRTEVARASTGADGVARLVVPPGRYEVVPLPPRSATAWVSTGGDSGVSVARAEQVRTTGGWVQPGTVSVGLFHDHGRDGVRDEHDEPLADRTVRLRSSRGVLLATAVTDATGRVAFPAQARTSYRVEAVVPTRWTATAPLAGRRVRTHVDVTAPADGAATAVEFGHYNTVDQLPPPAPATRSTGGTRGRPVAVTMTAESGARIRYTLDGTTPTARQGMLFRARSWVRVATGQVLKAVAVDAAGNASPVTAVVVDRTPVAAAAETLAARSWTANAGRVRGGAAETAADDGQHLHVNSAPLRRRRTADATADVSLPAALRSPGALNVSVSLRSTLRGTRVRLEWFDARAKRWRRLITQTQGLDEARIDVALRDAQRAVDADGTVRLRVAAEHTRPFDLVVDQLTVTAVSG